MLSSPPSPQPTPAQPLERLSPLQLALCALGVFALYFFGLGAYPLFDPDEPIYAQVGREMAQGAGWLSPHLGGALWFDKPPLFYWLTGASFSLFGLSDFAARLPSAILGAALVGLVYAWAKRDFGGRAALLCALVMATCLQAIVLARSCVTDMTLVCFLTLALLSYRRWLDEASQERSGWKWAALCGLGTGLAMLAKGPVAPLLLSLTFIAHLAWQKQLRILTTRGAFVAVGSALLVGLPWFAAMQALHGQKFYHDFIYVNNLKRFSSAEHANTGHWYSYFLNFPILLGFFFPWSLFLLQAIARAARTLRTHTPGAATTIRLALVWIAVVFAFFSTSKTILVTYIFPLYPAAALLVGLLFAASPDDERARWGVRVGAGLALAASLVLSVFLYATAKRKFPDVQHQIFDVGLILLVACGVALWLSTRRSPRFSPAFALGAGMTTLAVWLVLAILPRATQGQTTRDLVESLPKSKATMAYSGVRAPSLAFYQALRPNNTLLGAGPYVGSLDTDTARQALLGSAPVFIVCKADNKELLRVSGAREWARSGKLIVLANPSAQGLK